MARPRVLHVGKFYPPHRGGIETHLHDLCTELQQAVDVRVVVASTDRRGREDVVDGVRVARLFRLFDVASAPICPGLIRAIRGARADIVHLHLPNPAAVAAVLASGARGRLIATYHSDVVRQRVLGGAFAPILHRFLERCTAIVATSAAYVESSPVLRRHRERCRVIPFGVPLERFRRADDEMVASIRRRFGPELVLSVGRLIYYKGLEHLIAAMRRVKGRLLIIGEGPLRARLERQARALGLVDHVVFLGAVEDVVPYYHAANVFVLPSVARSEAFGLVQLEAMACGKPVVNTAIHSGVPTVSLDGVTGLTVPPADSSSLAAAIQTLLTRPDLQARFGAAARRRVEEQYTLGRMVERTLALYDEVLAV